jgi:hypothetical protein
LRLKEDEKRLSLDIWVEMRAIVLAELRIERWRKKITRVYETWGISTTSQTKVTVQFIYYIFEKCIS